MKDFLIYATSGLAVAGIVIVAIRLAWRAAGAYKVRRAGPRPLFGVKHRLWKAHSSVETLDLAAGPGGSDGAPVPPYQFIEEHGAGSQPCVSVRDARGRRWRVKWGHEVEPESFAVRLAWACGYFTEVTYVVPEGIITGTSGLQRANKCLDAGGRFTQARFELDDPQDLKLFEEHSWSWTDNPFVGTHELAGLKIVLMLVSNWDNKDQRDVARGSNTAIYVRRRSRWKREALYMVTDWGGSMGRWGTNVITRGRWDPVGFAAQTPQFVLGVRDGLVTFGYAGQRTQDAAGGITVEDVRWLCRTLERISDRQIRDALDASGATAEETASFAVSIRDRIDQLQAVAATGGEYARSVQPSTDRPARDVSDSGRAAPA